MVWAEGGVQMMIALTMMLAAMLAAHPAQVSGKDPAFRGRIRSQEPNQNRRRKTIPHSSQTHPPLPILAVILQLNRFQLLRLHPELLPSFAGDFRVQ